MLEHLNHPFLCNLRYSFQDIEYLYDTWLYPALPSPCNTKLTSADTLSWT
jgi:hypothetical protein